MKVIINLILLICLIPLSLVEAFFIVLMSGICILFLVAVSIPGGFLYIIAYFIYSVKEDYDRFKLK